MPSKAEILDQIIVQLQKIIPPETEIAAKSSIVGDLGLDSLAVMNFVLTLEDHFDVSLPMDRVAEVETIDDLAEAIFALSGGEH